MSGSGRSGELVEPTGWPPWRLRQRDRPMGLLMASDVIGQGSGGHSPAWHGASPQDGAEGQRNAAALSGYKTKEFGAEGFNQLVFDDSNHVCHVGLVYFLY